MAFRIGTILILFFSVIFLPFWVSALIGFLCLMYFKIFWEGAFLFLLSDLLYGAPESRFHNFTFVSFLGYIVLLIILEIIKSRIKFHKDNL